MNGYKAYDIKDTDRFNPHLFPEVRDELNGLFSAAYFFTTPEKENIIISFLKNHSLKSEWTRSEPELTRILTGNCCPTAHIESLFEAAKTNLQFLHSFEEYIRNIEIE
ncbi:MAG: hypothetical protein HZA79_13275 [Sphingobacteriales bacterium]|nr:hypothetical protein [Sphingobacteriales bacterium]